MDDPAYTCKQIFLTRLDTLRVVRKLTRKTVFQFQLYRFSSSSGGLQSTPFCKVPKVYVTQDEAMLHLHAPL